MNRRLSTLFLLATVCAANMLAYTIKPIHAITSEIVTAIHQDPMKFIWFGGSGGLARFDGYTLEEFQEHEAGNHMGYINSIHHSPRQQPLPTGHKRRPVSLRFHHLSQLGGL